MKIIIAILILVVNSDSIFGQCWSDVSLATNSTLIIDENNNLYACGLNFSGQLGIGSSYFSSDTLVEVLPKSQWVKISCGNGHTLAIKEDGSLWAWGNNTVGQLGNGNTQSQPTPIQIGFDEDWQEVNTGYEFSTAMKKDSTLWTWGRNLFGQLGLGDNIDRLSPTKISNTSWSTYSTGNVHTLAIREDGTLWAWGNNFNGQLGDGTTTESTIPKMISQSDQWKSISSEGLHSLSIKDDGTLWAWGNNTRGQLGLDTNITFIKTAIQVGIETNWDFITTSESNSAGIKTDGILWLWGSNEYGQLGFTSSSPQFSPIQFNNDNNWISISMGLFHIAGIKTNHTLYTWGRNNIGQLGIGNLVDSPLPTNIPCDSLVSSILIENKVESKIYPNPAKQNFKYISNKKQVLFIYNIDGIKIKECKVIEGLNSCDTSKLFSGNYIIVDEQGVSQKITIID